GCLWSGTYVADSIESVRSVRLLADFQRTFRATGGGRMQTVVIPRADWRATLDEFSSCHEGWRVSLELLTPELGAQHEIEDLPLRGVAVEVGAKGSTITIAAGSTGLDQVTSVIHEPPRAQAAKT